jgi:MerR family transcriptional regulator/heat shock protein HspR
MSDRPMFTIRIAAQLVGVHQQTLRAYEREGLVFPARSAGRQRLYSQADIDRLCEIRRLIEDLGVNLPGADIIIRQREEIRALKAENEQLRDELALRPPILPRRLRQRP